MSFFKALGTMLRYVQVLEKSRVFTCTCHRLSVVFQMSEMNGTNVLSNVPWEKCKNNTVISVYVFRYSFFEEAEFEAFKVVGNFQLDKLVRLC